MEKALDQAKKAFEVQEVPIGAVIIHNGQVIAQAHNLCIALKNPLAHAEALVIQQALLCLNHPYLEGCDLYVTLEPCAYCAGAIALTRIRRLFFGAYDPKGGGVEHGSRIFDHSLYKPEVYGGVNEGESSLLIKDFFHFKRRCQDKQYFDTQQHKI